MYAFDFKFYYVHFHQVDIIVSEWRGYFLLFESMLDTVLWARDHYLAPGGRIVPDFCDLQLVAVADAETYSSHVTHWRDVYGFTMSCMQSAVLKEASVCIVKDDYVITKPCVIKVLFLVLNPSKTLPILMGLVQALNQYNTKVSLCIINVQSKQFLKIL